MSVVQQYRKMVEDRMALLNIDAFQCLVQNASQFRPVAANSEAHLVDVANVLIAEPER